eukprot:TRINITY_DN6712_c0_g1_i13.p1 TRINITY_DN6712_c0_g1~~TRINITY_DN6712_c0_g1_i13.p1  ORF type:complete len:334 (-),score=46.73 TRINITY_DN6712_c0_g1_i13:70-1071(-)
MANLLTSSFFDVLSLMRSLSVRVILDLHQVEGCQNGFDNGGHAGVIDFYNSVNIQKGIDTWQSIIRFLQERQLLSSIWGFEILNEPIALSSSDRNFLQQFTETVVNTVISPVITKDQVIFLQPGPSNDLITIYESFDILSNLTVIFDFHEYICFGNPLYLTPMKDVISLVNSKFGNSLGAKKWPYIIGEWSLATTDCAQYLNGAFGGFDPNYYSKQHASRNTFQCNLVNQTRDGALAGWQTCSVVTSVPVTFPSCEIGKSIQEFLEYKVSTCKLFVTYVKSITSNDKNVGFSFWTYRTGQGLRRLPQWDFSWNVDQNIIQNVVDPSFEACDNL